MDPGLAHLLSLIESNTADTLLVDRYLVLAADLGEEPRTEATLKLANTILSSNARRAIELAHMVYQARPDEARSIEIMIDGFERLGRYGKATVLRYELEKMRGEGVSHENVANSAVSLAAAVDESVSTIEPENDVMSFEPPVANKSDDLVKNPTVPPSIDLFEPFSPPVLRWSDDAPVSKMDNLWDGRNETLTNAIRPPIMATPAAPPPTAPPPTEIAPPFELKSPAPTEIIAPSLNQEAHRQPARPLGIPDVIPPHESSLVNVSRSSKPSKSISNEALPVNDLSLVPELFDLYYKQGKYDEGRKVLDRAQGASGSESWFRERRALLERQEKASRDEVPLQEIEPPLAKIDFQMEAEPVKSHSISSSGPYAFEHQIPASATRAKALELIQQKDWESLWRMLVTHFPNGGDRELLRMARETKFYQIDTRFMEWWLSALVADGRSLFALSFAVKTLREHPHIAWARGIYKVIPSILERLRLRKVIWREENGVGELLRKLEMHRLRTPASIVILESERDVA